MKNHRIQLKNHANHENPKIKHDNHYEHNRIQIDNNGNCKNVIITN